MATKQNKGLSLDQVVAHFERKGPKGEPTQTHPGFKEGVNMWDWSMSDAPDIQYRPVNQNKVHFVSLDGQHHVGLKHGLVCYWQTAAAAEKAA